MKIGRPSLNPCEKRGDRGVSQQHITSSTRPCKLGVGEVRVDGAMADRMQRNGLTPSFCFRHGMVALHLNAERTMAKPAYIPAHGIRDVRKIACARRLLSHHR